MDWGFLSFLSEPWFVVPWYVIGLLGALVVAYDVRKVNTPLKQAMKWAWPIIILFFSVVGLALYYGTARAPGVGQITDDEEKKRAHQEYEKNMFRRVNGAVIHCVAGDGIGIMTGMVIARAVGMSFWQEFWFEYAVGFFVGWSVFQYKSMTMMTDSKGKALLMAFRAEFFSMLTVMAGMGAVMGYVTPLAATEQPKPLTFAFWGFGMLGLMVGYLLTFPMNWLMVKVGWKHGMGGMEAGHQKEAPPAKAALVTAMAVLGAAAMVLPAWLSERREGTPVGRELQSVQGAGTGGSPQSPVAVLGLGVRNTLGEAVAQLDAGRQTPAAHAVDAALRGAEVASEAAPGSPFERVVKEIKAARQALHLGDPDEARTRLQQAAGLSAGASASAEPSAPADLERYEGAAVVNANGVKIGEVGEVEGGRLRLSLGGAHDVYGFWDLGARQQQWVTPDELAFGPSRLIGSSLVALPTTQLP